jgi:hypothetical protein
MGDEGLSLEDCINLTHLGNREVRLYIGNVKDKNDFSYNFESGVGTSFSYKTPLVYNGRSYSDMRVVSFMADENSARTHVWGRPEGLNCLNEERLEEFCKSHRPFELPKIHEQTVKEIEGIHYKMFKDRINAELERERIKEVREPIDDRVPF